MLKAVIAEAIEAIEAGSSAIALDILYGRLE